MEAIGADWRALEDRAADPLTWFQSFEWCRAWCAFYAPEPGEGAAIRIFTAWQGERLVMVWPLMLAGEGSPVRRLEGLTEPHGQYGNVLLDPALGNDTGEVLRTAWAQIWKSERPDAFVLGNVPEGALPPAFSQGQEIATVAAGVISAMDLTPFAGSYEAYRAALKATTRRARNKRRNKLAGLGTLAYEVHFGGSKEYESLVGLGIDMKRDWLQRTGRGTRALKLPHVVEFLASLHGSPAGGALAAALTLDGRPIAIEIGFLHHRRFYSYLGAFDWELRDLSPGKVQLEEALRWSIESGVEVYDLLGDPSSYKIDWCNVTTPIFAYQASASLKGRAYLDIWHDRLRPALKRGFEKMPLSLRSRLLPGAEASVRLGALTDRK
ncbi:hypothetical protein CLD20_04140 [Afifella sp. IM 167]|nr:hypothetical protein [Afifella sp. IM 167]